MPLKSDELDMTEGHLWVEFTPGSLRLLTVQCHSLNQCLLRVKSTPHLQCYLIPEIHWLTSLGHFKIYEKIIN